MDDESAEENQIDQVNSKKRKFEENETGDEDNVESENDENELNKKKRMLIEGLNNNGENHESDAAYDEENKEEDNKEQSFDLSSDDDDEDFENENNDNDDENFDLFEGLNKKDDRLDTTDLGEGARLLEDALEAKAGTSTDESKKTESSKKQTESESKKDEAKSSKESSDSSKPTTSKSAETDKRKRQSIDNPAKELARKKKQEQIEEENKKMQVLMANFSEEQLNRYEIYRRSAFPKSSIKKIVQTVCGKTVSQSVVIAMSGISKVFVGEIVEKALDVKQKWNDTGPLQPKHLREAFRLFKNSNRLSASVKHKKPALF